MGRIAFCSQVTTLVLASPSMEVARLSSSGKSAKSFPTSLVRFSMYMWELRTIVSMLMYSWGMTIYRRAATTSSIATSAQKTLSIRARPMP